MQQVKTELKNPYWEELQENLQGVVYGLLDSTKSSWHERNEYCRKYTWSIPDPETLVFVYEWLDHEAIEMGAGTGYWASLLSAMGMDILAFDHCPPDRIGNHFHGYGEEHLDLRDIFYPVQIGNPETLAQHPGRTLFLCWPPYDEPMAEECLLNYPGERIVFVGEPDGGCTGNDAFFATLSEEWHLVAMHVPVQWDGIHDVASVYERGKRDEDAEDHIAVSRSALPERRRHNWFDGFLMPGDDQIDSAIMAFHAYIDSRAATFYRRCAQSAGVWRIQKWVNRVCPALFKKYYGCKPRFQRSHKRNRGRHK